MTEGRIVDHDVFVFDTFCLQVGFKDLVGGARINVVRAGENPTLHGPTILTHEIIDGGDSLLVRCSTRVKHIPFRLFTFVLHGIKQDRVELLEDWQH